MEGVESLAKFPGFSFQNVSILLPLLPTKPAPQKRKMKRKKLLL
jgi:hypothetical protein